MCVRVCVRACVCLRDGLCVCVLSLGLRMVSHTQKHKFKCLDGLCVCVCVCVCAFDRVME